MNCAFLLIVSIPVTFSDLFSTEIRVLLNVEVVDNETSLLVFSMKHIGTRSCDVNIQIRLLDNESIGNASTTSEDLGVPLLVRKGKKNSVDFYDYQWNVEQNVSRLALMRTFFALTRVWHDYDDYIYFNVDADDPDFSDALLQMMIDFKLMVWDSDITYRHTPTPQLFQDFILSTYPGSEGATLVTAAKTSSATPIVLDDHFWRLLSDLWMHKILIPASITDISDDTLARQKESLSLNIGNASRVTSAGIRRWLSTAVDFSDNPYGDRRLIAGLSFVPSENSLDGLDYKKISQGQWSITKQHYGRFCTWKFTVKQTRDGMFSLSILFDHYAESIGIVRMLNVWLIVLSVSLTL